MKGKTKKKKYFEKNMRLNVDCPSLSILVPKAKGGKYYTNALNNMIETKGQKKSMGKGKYI